MNITLRLFIFESERYPRFSLDKKYYPLLESNLEKLPSSVYAIPVGNINIDIIRGIRKSMDHNNNYNTMKIRVPSEDVSNQKVPIYEWERERKGLKESFLAIKGYTSNEKTTRQEEVGMIEVLQNYIQKDGNTKYIGVGSENFVKNKSFERYFK